MVGRVGVKWSWSVMSALSRTLKQIRKVLLFAGLSSSR